MTETEIYQQMLDAFLEETGYELCSESDLTVRLRAAAAQIMSLYHYGDYVYRQAFPQTAQDGNLDLHGALRGVARITERQATGILQFGISGALAVDLIIGAGTVCFTEEGTAFETLEDATLAAGKTSVDVTAQAVESGRQGNVVSGSIIRMQTAPDGIETVTNPEAFAGGRDRETDESYRNRILSAYRGLSNGANIAYYKALALSVDGIDGVQVVPRINGAGSVGLLVTADSGTVSDEALVNLNTLLNERRELGIEVVVSVPEEVAVTVKASILPADGYTLTQARSAVEEAIAGCFTGEQLGRTLYLAALSHSAMDTGTIENIVFTAPAGDVEVEENQQPVLASVTLEGL